MKTYLFAWNQRKWKVLQQAVSEANGESKYHCKWSCASYRNIEVGDRDFLFPTRIKRFWTRVTRCVVEL